MDKIKDLPGLDAVTADLRTSPHILTAPAEGASPSSAFDKKSAGEHLVTAMLPITYERTLSESPPFSDIAPVDKAQQEAAALQAVRARLPEGVEFNVFRHDNITAVVVHDPKTSRVTVAFDGGAGDLKDVGDILSFSPKPHPLGGQVHGGYLDSLARKDEGGTTIGDRVLAQVNAYAAGHEGPVDVHLTGVSRGGSVATLALADWMQDSARVHGNVHFSSLTTFGSPAIGDEAFTKAFDAKTKEHKLDEQWRVIAGDDSVPRQFTQDAWYKQDLYRQGGNVAYLIPGKNGDVTELVNPPKEELDKARAHLNPLTIWHKADKYAELLGLPETAFDVPAKSTVLPMKDTDTIEAPPSKAKVVQSALER